MIVANILVIDDDPAIQKLIQNALSKEGHTVDVASETSEVTLKKAQFADLILLDVMMPAEDGFAYLSRIRDQVDAPVLFVTAKTAETDLIHGFGLGADDYIEKPFSLAELRARVAAHLRREKRSASNAIRNGKVILHLAEKQISVGEAVIPFTKSEYAIAALLMERSGQVFSKDQICEAVFGFDGESDEHAIVEHIRNIRLKLRAQGEDPIETIWGVGYKWKKEKQQV